MRDYDLATHTTNYICCVLIYPWLVDSERQIFENFFMIFLFIFAKRNIFLLTYLIVNYLSTSADPRIKYSRRSILHYTNGMTEPAQPLDINTLHKVYVVEELIQVTIISNVKIILNVHWTEDLTYDFSLEYSQFCCIGA